MNAAIVREWLEHVEADLDAAWSCSRGPRARLDRTAYLLQQAAEKLVKAVLVSVDVDPPRTHDIAELVAEVGQNTPFRDRLSALCDLTPYATGFRYPTQEPPPLPSRERLDVWILEIETLKADFERWLEAQSPTQP
jgi:HEPN domain-containing protein